MERACAEPPGWARAAGDCDDADPARYPGAPEDDCRDPTDYNCDGSVGYVDFDGDGWPACEDCDDSDAGRFPEADETCDGVDDDCDGAVDESAVDAIELWADADGDGHGDAAARVLACAAEPGAVTNFDDCDDESANVHPGAPELCDGVDTDCDGTIQESMAPTDLRTIQDALETESWVCLHSGTHSGDLTIARPNVLVQSIEGAGSTILDGSGVGSAVHIATGSDGVVRIEGVTIQGGSAERGAGVYVEDSAVELSDVLITQNTCAEPVCWGSGIYMKNSTGQLRDSRVFANEATGDDYSNGVGIALLTGTYQLDHVTIDRNRSDGPADSRGTGLYVVASIATLEHVLVADNEANRAATYGLGAGFNDSAIDAENLIVAGNRQTHGDAADGALWHSEYTEAQYRNITVVGNDFGSDDVTCHGLSVDYRSTVHLLNANISAGQVAPGALTGGLVSTDDGSFLTAEYSNFHDEDGAELWFGLEPRVGEEGNISEDPMHTNTSSAQATTWDLTLLDGSALIDAGAPDRQDTDGTRSDIGALGGPAGDDW